MSSGGGAGKGDGMELLAWLPHSQRDPDFLSPERQRHYSDRLRALETRSVLWLHEAAGEGAIRVLRRELGVHVNPIVPNMRAYLRDASDHGVIGAALQRFRRLGILDQARIGLHNLRRAPGALTRDFATGVLVMVEMELVRFRRFGPSLVALNASVTDLALALDNDRLLREFVRLVERTYRLEAALATYNYGILADRLSAWRIRPSWIVAPFNPRGYLMNPSRAECERVLKGSSPSVIASHIEVDGLVERTESLEYLRGLGIRRAAADPTL